MTSRDETNQRTTTVLELHPPTKESRAGQVTISLGYPEHGWVQMAITCTPFLQGVIIDTTPITGRKVQSTFGHWTCQT